MVLKSYEIDSSTKKELNFLQQVYLNFAQNLKIWQYGIIEKINQCNLFKLWQKTKTSSKFRASVSEYVHFCQRFYSYQRPLVPEPTALPTNTHLLSRCLDVQLLCQRHYLPIMDRIRYLTYQRRNKPDFREIFLMAQPFLYFFKKWANPGLFLYLFLVFSNKQYNS